MFLSYQKGFHLLFAILGACKYITSENLEINVEVDASKEEFSKKELPKRTAMEVRMSDLNATKSPSAVIENAPSGLLPLLFNMAVHTFKVSFMGMTIDLNVKDRS